MSEPTSGSGWITPAVFHRAEGVSDWRVTATGPQAVVAAGSPPPSARPPEPVVSPPGGLRTPPPAVPALPAPPPVPPDRVRARRRGARRTRGVTDGAGNRPGRGPLSSSRRARVRAVAFPLTARGLR